MSAGGDETGTGLSLAELGLLRRAGETIVLRQSRTWPVDREELWAALTVPERLERWIGTPDAPLDAPRVVRFDQGGGSVTEVSVTGVTPGERLAMTWHVPEEGAAEVVLSIHEVDGEVDGEALELELTYAATDEEQVRSAVGAWLSYLDALGDSLGATPPTSDGSQATRGIMRLAAAVELSRQLPVA